MGSAGFGAVLVRFAIGAAGVAVVGCHSNGGSSGAGGGGGLTASGGGSGAAGNGGASATGGGGSPGVDGGGGIDGGLPASAACTPGVGTGPLSDTELDCTNDGTTFGVPNGAAVTGKVYVLPSPLVASEKVKVDRPPMVMVASVSGL